MREGTGRRDRTGSIRSLLAAVAAVGVVAVVGLVLASGGLPAGGADATPSTVETERTSSTGDRTDPTAERPTDAGSPDASPARTTSRGTPTSGIEGLANAAVTIAGEGADELGFSVAVGDANGDGEPDLLIGAPLRNASGTRSGAAVLFYGPLESGALTTADADATFVGESEWNWAGNAVEFADVNGDGTDDVVIGAPLANAAGPAAGAVYVAYGGDLSGRIPLSEADARLTGISERSFAGYSIDAADVLGGPGADLLVGAPRANVSGPESGAAYLVAGDDLSGETSLADADATFVGAAAGDRAGHAVAFAGDVDGDGRVDPVIGARQNDSAGADAGAAYVLVGNLDGRRSLAEATVTLVGTGARDHAGFDVAGAGDVNGDGYADVLVGAPFDDAGGDDAGAAYVVYGGPDLPARASLSDADATIRGAAPGDRAGYSVAGAGDATCDGRDDLLVGAPRNDTGGAEAGAAYLVRGAAVDDGTASLDGAALALTGADSGDQVGRADRLAAFRRDGGVGIVVGAPFGDAPATAHVVHRACPADPS